MATGTERVVRRRSPLKDQERFATEPGPCMKAVSLPERGEGPGQGGVKSRLLERRKVQPLSMIVSAPNIDSPYNLRRISDMRRYHEDYEVDNGSPLGCGSFSTVRRGFRRKEQRQVALKVVVTLDEAEKTASLEREFETLRGLRHPHIIEAIDFFIVPRSAVLVLEFFSGAPLAATST